MPSLSAFIREHRDEILSEWEAFARTTPVGPSMSVAALRDHAQAMLDAIVIDLEAPQTAREQSDKGKGLAPEERRQPVTAAAEHGHGRAESGFTVVQMVAEFRALRASVVRLWTAHEQHFGQAELEELIRFNEAIDQTIAESLARYSSDVDETRERFLAILGHDLRNPLAAITTSSSFLVETGRLSPEQTNIVQIIQSAGRRMTGLVADLLELALTRPGDQMPVNRGEMDVAAVVRDVATEIQASYPTARIETHLSGDLAGSWDVARLTQALTNLVSNAVQHGDATAPISLNARGDEREVVIDVHNEGAPIPPDKMGRIFNGVTRGSNPVRDRRHLGLGLFIVDRIVEGHGGTIDIQSAAGSGTTFTVHLPRVSS
jgi:signal transduction histidine kinase